MTHYVMPAAGHLEDWGLAYNYNVCHCVPYLMIRKKAVEPYYESRSALKLYQGIAERMGLGDQFPWKSEEDLVAYELEPSGLPFDVLLNSKPQGEFYQQKSYEITERTFATPSRKIEIYSDTMEIMGNDPLPTYTEPEKGPLGSRWAELGERYPLVLATGTRSIYYTNSQFRHIASLREKCPDPEADLGPETARRYGVADGDFVIIESDRGQVRMKAKVSDRTVEGVVVVPHGWHRDGNCNLLTDCNCREKDMGYPQWKGILCSIRKA